MAFGKKALRSWMILYAGFIAAIALSNEKPAMAYAVKQELSPVALGADTPALTIDTLVRRSDI